MSRLLHGDTGSGKTVVATAISVCIMENQKDVDDTRRDLEIDKLFKTIREQVTITEKAIPSEEFHKLIDAVSAKAQAEQEEAQNLL